MATMRLTLLVDEKTEKVEYAECENDFVDVLFSFLTVPIWTIICLTGKESKIGGMSTLYESVKDLNVTKAGQEMLLSPKNASEKHCKNLKVNIYDTEIFCNAGQSTEKQPIYNEDGVFVEKNKFIIRYDLQVSSSDSIEIQGIDTSKFKKVDVNVGKAQVLHLLKRSLLSETPLTDMIGAFRLKVLAQPPKEKGNASASKNVSVKLAVNKSNKKVVYAEGGEEFADLLFSFLAFPLGFVAKFFGGDTGIKCLDNLYRSVQVLKKFIESKECEGLLADPT